MVAHRAGAAVGWRAAGAASRTPSRLPIAAPASEKARPVSRCCLDVASDGVGVTGSSNSVAARIAVSVAEIKRDPSAEKTSLGGAFWICLPTTRNHACARGASRRSSRRSLPARPAQA
jgi:hypothetical protein